MTLTARRTDRIAASVVRYIFIIASIGLLAFMSVRGQWEAQLRISDAETFIFYPPNSPIWQPPPVPEYGDFTEIFGSLPKVQPETSAIIVLYRWDSVAIELFVCLWLITSSVGLLYLMTRGTCVDTLLHSVLYVAIGLTAAAFAYIGLLFVSEAGHHFSLVFAI